MARKTLPIDHIRNRGNDMLSKSAAQLTDGRIAVAILLEGFLMDADVYKGFEYTDGANGTKDPTLRRYF